MDSIEENGIYAISVANSQVIQPSQPHPVGGHEVQKNVSIECQEKQAPQDKCIVKLTKAVGLGVPQIVFGIVCLTLNVYIIIITIDDSDKLFDFTYGIWSGVVFIVSGLLEVLTRNAVHCKVLRMVTLLISTGTVFVAMVMIPYAIIDLIYDPTESSFVLNCTNITNYNVERPELFNQVCITFVVMGFLEMLFGVLSCALYSKSFLCDMSKVTHSIYDVITAPVMINKELTKIISAEMAFAIILCALHITPLYILFLGGDFLFYGVYGIASILLYVCFGMCSCFSESESEVKTQFSTPPNSSTVSSAIIIMLCSTTSILISSDIRTDLIDHNVCRKTMNTLSMVKFYILTLTEAVSLLMGAFRLIQFFCWLICRKTIIEFNKSFLKRKLENSNNIPSPDCSTGKAILP